MKGPFELKKRKNSSNTKKNLEEESSDIYPYLKIKFYLDKQYCFFYSDKIID